MITVISSTNRKNSYTRRVADIYQHLLTESGKPNQLLSLEVLPHDFLFSDFDGNRTPPFQLLVEKYIQGASHYVFVIPEYNGGFPGILKGFIDCIRPADIRGKKAALIGVADGHAGALRPLDDFTLILHHLRLNVYFDKPKLSLIDKHFSADGTLSPDYFERIRKQAEGFQSF